MECAGWYIPPPSIFLPHPFSFFLFIRAIVRDSFLPSLFPSSFSLASFHLPLFFLPPLLFLSFVLSLFLFSFRNVTTRETHSGHSKIESSFDNSWNWKQIFWKKKKKRRKNNQRVLWGMRVKRYPEGYFRCFRYWSPLSACFSFIPPLLPPDLDPSFLEEGGRNCTVIWRCRTNRLFSRCDRFFSGYIYIYISGWQSSRGKIETRIDHFAL